jgi:4'-phosphopantetheinyl transferase
LDPLSLTPGQIRFFYTRIGPSRDTAQKRSLENLLNEKEKQKIDRFVFEKDRHARRAARVFLKQILARCIGRDPDAIHFTENRYGKPALAGGITDLPIGFNLSHSGHVVVCALTLTHDIGVDIEDMQRSINLSIADRFFSNQEAQAIARADPSLKQSLFYRFWTLKEAYAKATGRGLANGLDQFSFVLDRPDIRVIFHSPGQEDSGHWQFFQFSPVPGYMAAVAVNKKTGPPLTLSVHPWVWE